MGDDLYDGPNIDPYDPIDSDDVDLPDRDEDQYHDKGDEPNDQDDGSGGEPKHHSTEQDDNHTDDEGSVTVPNGECVIGSVEEAMRKAGINVEEDKVKKIFGRTLSKIWRERF